MLARNRQRSTASVFLFLYMAISANTRRQVVGHLTKGGLAKCEISERLGVAIEDVRAIAEALWKKHRSYDYTQRANPWTR